MKMVMKPFFTAEDFDYVTGLKQDCADMANSKVQPLVDRISELEKALCRQLAMNDFVCNCGHPDCPTTIANKVLNGK